MDNLKSIWNQLDHNINDSVDIDFKTRNSIIDNFQEEMDLRKRYNPLLVLFIILFAGVFIYIVSEQENTLSISKYIGIALVVLSGVIIAYFSQRVKTPFRDLNLNNSAITFARLCKSYLEKARLNLVIGIGLQLVFLSTGLYLLIFFENTSPNPGMIGAFFGGMFSLCGFAIGGAIAAFNRHYKGLFEVANQFAEAE